MTADRIKFNVGGQLFETTRSTVAARHPDSMLASLISFPRQGDEDAPYFLDRDPTVFRAVLQYLRTARLTAPTGVSPAVLADELAFYGLGEVEPVAASPAFHLVTVTYAGERDEDSDSERDNDSDGERDDDSDGEEVKSEPYRLRTFPCVPPPSLLLPGTPEPVVPDMAWRALQKHMKRVADTRGPMRLREVRASCPTDNSDYSGDLQPSYYFLLEEEPLERSPVGRISPLE